MHGQEWLQKQLQVRGVEVVESHNFGRWARRRRWYRCMIVDEILNLHKMMYQTSKD
jgi:hypothetical protein